MDIKTFLQKRKLESIAINQIEQFNAQNSRKIAKGMMTATAVQW